MRNKNSIGPIISHLYYSLIVILIIVLDQGTKYLVRANMRLYKSISIIPNFFNLVYVMNPGGAFGLWANKSSSFRNIFFNVLGVAAIIILIAIYLDSSYGKLMRLGIIFLLGGALGNIIDRIKWHMVVDFLEFYFRSFRWPAFNVADIAICIGMGLFLLEFFIDSQKKAKKKEG